MRAHATGGNFSGFRDIADLVQPGFPIAEIAADGSSVITKDPGTGGAVTEDTVTAQLLYEIGEPAYLNPDVTTHLNTAELTDLGDDRVQIRAVRGSAPPATSKVAITAMGGWQNSMILALTGNDPDAKAELVERSVHRYTEVDGVTRSRSTASDRLNRIPTARTREPSYQDRRAGHQGRRRARLLGADGRAGAVQLPRLIHPRPAPTRVGFGVYWPALLDQAILDHSHHKRHDRDHRTRQPTQRERRRELAGRPSATPPLQDSQTDKLVVAPLGEIVHARSGDKGGDANLGVWVHDREAWEWLKSTLTVEELRRLLTENAN